MKIPWGIHTISDMYRYNVQAYVNNKWHQAVMEPCTTNRLRAAWWVLTGRAHAVVWPKDGDLEKTLKL